MNKFQLECLAYLLVLILLTICAVKELRKIILDIYDKEKTKESSLIYKLYLDSFNLNKIKLKK